ncbi:hypothetical protein B0H13DRAFT_2275356 [Mycena leptocephala]|nr:hypothetical protein B0H13DRAFT_2275356 [Mycena leptocephala]
MKYYQLGGFNASVYSHPQYPLAEKVYEALRQQQHPYDGGMNLELVLGIKPSGTSHVLLIKDERDAIRRESSKVENSARVEFHRTEFKNDDEQQTAWDALQRTFLRWKEISFTPADFESVSPIAFLNIQELSLKAESLKPARQAAQDTSPANKAYADEKSHAVNRGQFENCRVLYRVLQNNIHRTKCDLGDTAWSSSIRVFSFCYNTWSADNRSMANRRNHPKILDIGWCEAQTPTLGGENQMPKHIAIKENQHLRNPGKNDRYEYGETEICSVQVAAQRIQAVFGRYTSASSHPALILVHDVETAIIVFQNFGVDVSQWDYQLKNLLRVPGSSTDSASSQVPARRRSRSASPVRGERPRRDSPPPRRYAPMYVADIKALFIALLGKSEAAESVPRICKRLDLFRPDGWCAGNESWMLVDVFRRMAAGSEIDEQCRDWPEAVQSVGAGEGDVSDSDYGDSDNE